MAKIGVDTKCIIFIRIERTLKEFLGNIFESQHVVKHAKILVKKYDDRFWNENMEMKSMKSKLDVSGKITEAESKKIVGNDHFKSGNLKQAIKNYHVALLYLKDIEKMTPLDKMFGKEPEQLSDSQLQKVQDLRGSCFNNLAACLLKKQNYEKVIQYTTQVLEIEPRNVKALFRRGQGHYYKQNLEKAEEDFLTIKKIDEKETCVDKFLPLIESANKRVLKKEKELYRKMMNAS